MNYNKQEINLRKKLILIIFFFPKQFNVNVTKFRKT